MSRCRARSHVSNLVPDPMFAADKHVVMSKAGAHERETGMWCHVDSACGASWSRVLADARADLVLMQAEEARRKELETKCQDLEVENQECMARYREVEALQHRNRVLETRDQDQKTEIASLRHASQEMQVSARPSTCKLRFA